METICSNSLWSLLSRSERAESTSCSQARKDNGHVVRSYLELATKVADLQFRNEIMYSCSEVRPPITGIHRIVLRFVGSDRLKRHQILRWSILQHYEVCKTPLLDVTQSLRIAASFASASPDGGDVFLMVLGVPNISGAITASDEAGLQIVRLASACPPNALRPHVQEGFLLGEYPGMVGLAQKQHYKHYEMDFGRRLIAKFRFNPSTFWRKDDGFPKVEQPALYPNDNDPLFRLAESIKSDSAAE